MEYVDLLNDILKGRLTPLAQDAILLAGKDVNKYFGFLRTDNLLMGLLNSDLKKGGLAHELLKISRVDYQKISDIRENNVLVNFRTLDEGVENGDFALSCQTKNLTRHLDYFFQESKEIGRAHFWAGMFNSRQSLAYSVLESAGIKRENFYKLFQGFLDTAFVD